jgi:hypothetical protein
MPRSGTKLTRALLNQHPDIGLAPAETQFIPFFVSKFGDPPRLAHREASEKFVELFLGTRFFRAMQAAGYDFDREEFRRIVDFTSWSSIYE